MQRIRGERLVEGLGGVVAGLMNFNFSVTLKQIQDMNQFLFWKNWLNI